MRRKFGCQLCRQQQAQLPVLQILWLLHCGLLCLQTSLHLLAAPYSPCPRRCQSVACMASHARVPDRLTWSVSAQSLGCGNCSSAASMAGYAARAAWPAHHRWPCMVHSVDMRALPFAAHVAGHAALAVHYCHMTLWPAGSPACLSSACKGDWTTNGQ